MSYLLSCVLWIKAQLSIWACWKKGKYENTLFCFWIDGEGQRKVNSVCDYLLYHYIIILKNVYTSLERQIFSCIASCIIRTGVTSREGWRWMTVGEVATTIRLYWPEFRHKQEIAYRKEVIFFTAVPWMRTATFSIYVWDLLKMSEVCSDPFSITHNLKNDKKTVRERLVFVFSKENCGHCLFLSPLKRPFPALATDKPFCLFVLFLDEDQSTRSRLGACDPSGCRDLYGTYILRYSSHLQVTAINQMHGIAYVYAVAVRQHVLVLKQRCFVLLKDKNTVVLMGVSRLSSSLLMGYLTHQCNTWETYPQEHAHFLHT